jgi:hypothetical protein
MTKEANGIPTGRFNWKGEEEFVYVPNFDELVKNASCEEEIKRIREIEETMKSEKVSSKGSHLRLFTWFTKKHLFSTKKQESKNGL